MYYNRRRRFFWIPFFGLLVFALLSGATMWLWNHVLVEVVAVRSVTIWQAAGLLVLSRLLFGSWPGRGGGQWRGGPNWKAKWQQMTDEEKARFKEKWRNRG